MNQLKRRGGLGLEKVQVVCAVAGNVDLLHSVIFCGFSDFNFTSCVLFSASLLPLNQSPSTGHSLSRISAIHPPSFHLKAPPWLFIVSLAFPCTCERMSSGREGGALWYRFSVIPECLVLGLCPLTFVTFQYSPYCAHYTVIESSMTSQCPPGWPLESDNGYLISCHTG